MMLMSVVAAEAKIPDIKFRRLDTRDGLSHSQVNCVMRDAHGFVWIGTAYGLNRYDGYRLKSFYSDRLDSTSMRDNYCDRIYEAYDGKIWLKQGMGYCVYDPLTERFERDASRELSKYLGPHNAVEMLYIDGQKNFWVKYYEEGIFYYNPRSKKATAFRMGYEHNQYKPSYGFSTLADYGDCVVVASANGELTCLNGEKGTVEWEDTWMRDHGGLPTQDYKLRIDADRNFWVVTQDYTFIYIRKENKWYSRLTDLLRSIGVADVPDHLEVWDVQFDKQGRLWVATDHQGIFVVDLQRREMRQFLNNKFDTTTLSDNTPKSIHVDSQGHVWIGTYKNGVNQYVNRQTSMRSLELGDINTVVEDDYGNWWLGTNDNGLIVYNPHTEETVAHYTVANSPMLSNVVVGSHRASDGSLWFGSYNGGMNRVRPRGADGQADFHHYRVGQDANGLANNNVWSITEDRWHRMWIATLGGGLQMLDLKTGRFRTWNSKNTQLPSDYLTSAGWIKKGWLLLGTSWYYSLVNPVTGRLVNRTIPESPNVKSISFSSVCVMEDSRGLLWQGSSSGACVHDQRTGRVWQLDMSSGLFGSSVCAIVEDKSRMIWIVTDHGVSKVIPERQDDGSWQFIVSSYNTRDGLQNGTYNQRSAHVTRDGLLLVGGQGGLDIINPQAMSDVKSTERPIFSGLQLFDSDVPVGREVEGRSILDEALDVVRDVTLRYDDQFTIQLGSDAGIINNAKRFVYRLEGFSDNWVKTSELNPNITYNSLSPGSYTLVVRMLNDDGTYGETEASLDITIRPPLWRSGWAMLVYVLLVVLVAWGWYRWMTSHQLKRMEVESMRRELEKRQWMSEMLHKQSLEQATHAAGAAHPMEPERLAADKHLGDLVDFVRELCTHEVPSVNGKRVKVSFISNADSIDVCFDRGLIADMLRVLFRNSAMFSPGECLISVGVALTRDGKAQLQVADNGIGIKDEYKEHAFDPIIGGEGIGLDHVKAVVVAHDGEIRIEDNPGGGTVFVITLPVADDIEEAIVMDDEE